MKNDVRSLEAANAVFNSFQIEVCDLLLFLGRFGENRQEAHKGSKRYDWFGGFKQYVFCPQRLKPHLGWSHRFSLRHCKEGQIQAEKPSASGGKFKSWVEFGMHQFLQYFQDHSWAPSTGRWCSTRAGTCMPGFSRFLASPSHIGKPSRWNDSKLNVTQFKHVRSLLLKLVIKTCYENLFKTV